MEAPGRRVDVTEEKAVVSGGEVAETGLDGNTPAGMPHAGAGRAHRDDVMLDLDKHLPQQLTASCVLSDPRTDHTRFNGFLESPGGEEEEEVEKEMKEMKEEEEEEEEEEVQEVQEEVEEGLSTDAFRFTDPSDPDLDDIIGEIWDTHVDVDSFPPLPNGDLGDCVQTEVAWKSCHVAKIPNGGLHILQTGDLSQRDFPALTELTSDRGDASLAPASCPTPDSAISEEDEDISELSLPLRPRTLRTNLPLGGSLSCDATPLSPDEEAAGFYYGEEGYGSEDLRHALEGRRQSAPEQLQELRAQGDGQQLLPKRFGIAHFFTRSLFSRKPKETKVSSHNATGWRLFGKSPKESDPSAQPEDSPQDESHTDPTEPPSSSSSRRKNLEFEPLSTTALILEDRPSNLPAKSMEETQRHKQEYEQMVAGAKRRELREAQRKKLQMKERHRQEDCISNAMVVWNTEILPNWDLMRGSRRVRELWWQGLPRV
ncbi:unnamed protein product [Knipowitschia caucasica]